MREKAVENQIKDVLKKQGRSVYFFKHAASCQMPPGIADIICCVLGKSLWIETKAPKGIQSERQKVFQKEIEDAGGVYMLCPSFNDFARQWNKFVKEIKNERYKK